MNWAKSNINQEGKKGFSQEEKKEVVEKKYFFLVTARSEALAVPKEKHYDEEGFDQKTKFFFLFLCMKW